MAALSPLKGHLAPPRAITRAITTLSDSPTEILNPDVVHRIPGDNPVKTVLSTLWPVAFSRSYLMPKLHLFFGDRVYRDGVTAQVMSTYSEDDDMRSSQIPRSTTALLADSYKSSTLTQRPIIQQTYLCPVFRLRQLHPKALSPANSDHDAYFVAILIAMAQHHFYRAPEPSFCRDSRWSSEHPPFKDITLRILTHDDAPGEFIVYTGHVSASFLDRFHDPSKTPMNDDNKAPGIKIEYTRIPIWPILGLRERLGIAVGKEIVGEFDASELEPWETDIDSTQSRDVK
ncbi:hypothetical protein QQS21_008778 [Conoideocrella luteorostrata]|uniref:Uncharacterized protein n=1 Tax=Conoideocrella luteorostrata TaxID=1105319 RepID=A0AAJ0CKY2_9HYPO|nr:hypothetical protein QQS21_008778 [Conoideocrella luteorostrata]